MTLHLFKTPSNLPFLYYSTKEVEYNGQKHPQMTLDVAIKPIIVESTFELDGLWTIEHNANIQRAYERPHGRIFAAQILRNAVARKSRRSVANILIVPNEIEKLWFDEQISELRWNDLTVHVDPSLRPNELRATYWKITYDRDNIPRAVDGGLQFSPEGFSCIQKEGNCWYDYHSYFVRGFM